METILQTEKPLEDSLTRLMHRFGLTTPPTYQTRLLPVNHLVIQGTDVARVSGSGFSTNISLVGILHAPLVVLETGTSIDDPDATYRVVAGRRRVIGAIHSGLVQIECRVYDTLTPEMKALFILSENMHRAPAWVEELKALAELTSERVGLTDTELAKALGVSIAKIREQLKLVQLPQSLLDAMFASSMSLSTAKQITRLSKGQQAHLADLAESGTEITADLVEQELHSRIDQGLVPLQTALAEVQAPFESEGEPAPLHDFDMTSITQMLLTWEQSLGGKPGMSKVCLFMRALRQEVGLLKQEGPETPRKG